MSKIAALTLFLFITILGTSKVFAQADQSLLLNTWYAIKVGNPEDSEMFPTKNKEIFTFRADGTVQLEASSKFMGDMEFDGQWQYDAESQILSMSLVFDGVESKADLTVRTLTEQTLVLASPDKITEYSTSPPDPNAPAPKTAPLVVGSDSNIDAESWSGLHPFNTKITYYADDQSEETEAVGVIILLMIDDKKTLRINEDGVTTDIEVSGGSTIANQKHFGFVTEDPEKAGEIVFYEDGHFYLYYDKDQSAVEYINK